MTSTTLYYVPVIQVDEQTFLYLLNLMLSYNFLTLKHLLQNIRKSQGDIFFQLFVILVNRL